MEKLGIGVEKSETGEKTAERSVAERFRGIGGLAIERLKEKPYFSNLSERTL